MLTELSLQEFKGHACTGIPLQKLTVLVGPNASGKTSVLEAARILALLSRDVHVTAVLGEEPLLWLVRQGAKAPMVLRGRGIEGTTTWTGSLTVPSDGDISLAAEEWVPAPSPFNACQPLLLRLSAARLGEPSYSDREEPVLAEDGYGLATVLSSLKLTSTDRFRELEDAARRVIPRLRGLGFKRTARFESRPRTLTVEGQSVVLQEKSKIIADELLLDFDDAAALPARFASEGTLVVLGILAALHAPAPTRLLLLDDLDRALHPRAQRDLVTALDAALRVAPGVQIVATTHSPYLVDGLSPEQVVVLGRAPDGVVSAKRLSDHPKARLLDALTTGEFWAAEGEDWAALR